MGYILRVTDLKRAIPNYERNVSTNELEIGCLLRVRYESAQNQEETNMISVVAECQQRYFFSLKSLFLGLKWWDSWKLRKFTNEGMPKFPLFCQKSLGNKSFSTKLASLWPFSKQNLRTLDQNWEARPLKLTIQFILDDLGLKSQFQWATVASTPCSSYRNVTWNLSFDLDS